MMIDNNGTKYRFDGSNVSKYDSLHDNVSDSECQCEINGKDCGSEDCTIRSQGFSDSIISEISSDIY